MTTNSQVKSFPLSMRILHWGMAALVLSLLLAGLAMVQSLQPWQVTLLTLHKAFGVIAFVTVVVRLVNRLRQPIPELPAALPAWQKLAARGSHLLLYAAMIAMPVSGYLMQSAAGRAVDVFGLFTLPPLMSADIVWYSVFREAHSLIAYALIALIVLHIAAALQHGLVRKDGVLKSMWK